MCIYILVDVYVNIHIHTHIYIYVCIYDQVPINICTYVCLYTHMYVYMNKCWRRKWQATAVFWPGKFHVQRSLGLRSMGSQRVSCNYTHKYVCIHGWVCVCVSEAGADLIFNKHPRNASSKEALSPSHLLAVTLRMIITPPPKSAFSPCSMEPVCRNGTDTLRVLITIHLLHWETWVQLIHLCVHSTNMSHVPSIWLYENCYS